MAANTGYTIFETFVGAGGSHLGFMQENFRTVYVNDFIPECLQTLVYNNPNLEEEKAFVDGRSIEIIDPKELRKKLNIAQGEVDVFFGGVVCKSFSLAGERNPIDDGILNSKVYISDDEHDPLKEEISQLWKKLESYKGRKAALRKTNSVTKDVEEEGILLREEKKALLKEVEASDKYISVIEDIRTRYKDLGYELYISVLNSAWYGAATKRERVIIVAVRNDLGLNFEFPTPLYMDKSIFRKDLDEKFLSLPKPRTVNNALSLIDYSIEDKDNEPMSHSAKTIERFKYIPEGESIAKHIDSLPSELKISKFYSRGSTMRLAGNQPSPTLVPGHSNFPIHPKEHRSITVREAAVITGFPLDYKFFGTHSKRCEHVGNAVPPPLAQALARSCQSLLDKYYKGGHK